MPETKTPTPPVIKPELKKYDKTTVDLVNFCFTIEAGPAAGRPGENWVRYADRLHPTDRAKALRLMEAGFGRWAKEVETMNERIGVPERSQGG